MYQEIKEQSRLGDVKLILIHHQEMRFPTYLEIEGKSKEQVEEMIEKLSIDKKTVLIR